MLVGGSIGGTAVLLAAPRVRPIVAGAVCVSCVGNLADYVGGSQTQYDAARAMPNLRAALLIMGATDDPIVDLPLYRRLIRLAATHDKALALFPGGAHGARLFDSTVSGPAATTRLLEFLARHPQIGSIGGWTGGCSAPGIGSV